MTPLNLPISSPQNHKLASDRIPATLIYEIANGNEQALTQLYELTRFITYNMAFKTLGNKAAAEETTLEVYLQVWKQAPVYSEARGTPFVWLVTIIRSRAIDRLRQDKRLQSRVTSLEEFPLQTTNHETPESASLIAERCHQVRAALAQLTPSQREVLSLAYYFGMTQTEIAQHLGFPLGTIKTRIRYGLLQMKRILYGSPVG